MFNSFKLSMAWVHTWFGLVLGFVLMVCFFFGSLAVFDREIDRWAIPETRFEPQPMPSFDRVLLPTLQALEPDPVDYATNMPRLHDPSKGPMTPRTELPVDEYWAYVTHRDPVLSAGVGYGVPLAKNPEDHNHIHKNVTIDPRTGAVLPDDKLKIGSRWFYPMHYSLQLKWKNLGIFMVGLAALVMLAALVTGLIMHRKVFREFFTFRPWKRTQRASLDLHNLTGVVGLPFHFFFAFTGLVIFAGHFYLPVASTLLDPLHKQHEATEAVATGLPHERAGVPAGMASVDAMVEEAKRRWAERDMAGEVGFLVMHHVGDANSYVSIYRAGSDRVALVGEGIHFKTSTGELLSEDSPRSVVSETNEFLTGLHLQHFEHWFLRWLYVLGGLLGAVCIATGFVFFVEKRKAQHAKTGSAGARVVDAMAVTTTVGMVLAAVGMLLANRLLPADLLGKGDVEKYAFWAVWVAALLHAALRSAPVRMARINPAWREQCWALAAVCVLAVGSNWLSTGDHLIKTVFTQPYWPVAGVDLSLLACAAVSAWAGLKLAARERGAENHLNGQVTAQHAGGSGQRTGSHTEVAHG